MVIDSIENAGLYYGLGQGIKRALRFLQQDVKDLPDGRIDIDGDNLFAIVQQYTTKASTDGFWEAHRKYIDVQFVVSGRELIGYAPATGMQVTEFNEERDLVKLDGSGNFIELNANTFMILFPHDAHMPGIMLTEPSPVKKIVIKVAVSDTVPQA